MRQARFRALITLYSLGPSPAVPDSAVPQYQNRTSAFLVGARHPRAGSARYFASEICWDGERPLRPGDSCVVRMTVTDADDEVGKYLGAGRHFTLWSRGEVGYGTISREAYAESSPS